MIEVGYIVKSKYQMDKHRARMGLVTKLAGESDELAQVFYPHNRSTGWVKCEDMEIVCSKT
tara:strand:- start:508 stop:690 length:183 start_codon:yes stop_codon:yes gene_type:complete